MAEAGVDISRQASKHLDAVAGIPFDYVITVCDSANEACPVFPAMPSESTSASTIHPSWLRMPRPKKRPSATIAASAMRFRAFVERLPDALIAKGPHV